MTLFILILLAALTPLGVLYWLLLHAPVGDQDENGFHKLSPDSPHKHDLHSRGTPTLKQRRIKPAGVGR